LQFFHNTVILASVTGPLLFLMLILIVLLASCYQIRKKRKRL